jgi:hypothetical protein
MAFNFERNRLMGEEWDAWRKLIEELAKFGIDIEKEQPHKAIVEWGNKLAALRKYE